MAKKELSNAEHNAEIFSKIEEFEAKIAALKAELKPIELPKQADLNMCNALARKANVQPTKVNPKLVAEESGIKSK